MNKKCPMAARRAVLLAPMAARLAVMVVPMFSPSTRAQAVGKLIIPAAAQVSVMAMTALEDCKIMVSTVPVKISKIKVQAVSGENLDSHSTTNGLWAKSAGMAFFMMSKPKNSKPKPNKPSAVRLAATHLAGRNWLKKPMAITGRAKSEIWILKPNKLTIQAVIVVPMFAPNMTPKD